MSNPDNKPALKAELQRLCGKVPPSVVNGSIQLTRQWRAAQEQGLKLIKSEKSSVQKLQAGISAMRRFL